MEEKSRFSIENIKEILTAKGVKPSYQRLRILEYVIKEKNHPSVDTIFRSLSKKIPTLSRTTIYNTLSLLSDKKIVSALTLDCNEIKYDFMKQPHAHFQCCTCHEIYDIPLDSELFRTDFVDGHEVKEAQINFRGTCGSCISKEVSVATASQ